MFVQRLAGPSRLGVGFKSRHTHLAYSIMGKRRMARKAGGRITSALIDPRALQESGNEVNRLEQIKEQGEQMEKTGNRGKERRPMDETELPTMDVYMSIRPTKNARELYFPYYPLKPWDWPFFARFDLDNYLPDRLFSRSYWGRTLSSPSSWKFAWLWSIGRGVENVVFFILETLGRFHWRLLTPRGFKAAARRMGKPIAKYLVNAAKKGPPAKEQYLNNLANERANWRAMLLIASKQRFPEWFFAETLTPRIPWKLHYWYPSTRRQRKLENRLFTDLSSDNSPLYAVLRDAGEQYIEMNETIASGDGRKLKLFASKGYLKDITTRTAEFHSQDSTQKWKFVRWISPPVCLSIRSNDFFSAFNRSFIAGERLYLNMIVKFESIQSLTIRNDGSHSSKRFGRSKTITRPVTEYLVLDVRTWVDGRKPKFIQEIFEGQKLDIKKGEMSPEQMLGLTGKKDDDEKDKTAEGVSTSMSSSSTATGQAAMA